MAYKSQPKRQPAKRTRIGYDEYVKRAHEVLDWYQAHDVQLVTLEHTYYPETGGTKWVATIEIGYDTGELKPVIVALKFAGVMFPGIYDPRAFEMRGNSVTTFEVSWFTNPPTE